jgi:diguanylate cyclase (GGDEF)-like protein
MQAAERRRVRKHGVVLATLGLMVVMGVGLLLRIVGIVHFPPNSWLLAVGATLAVQSALWLVPHLRWDERLTWDRHYLIVPMLSTALLLDLYVYLIPDSRVRMLMVWFVALLTMAGRGGFLAVGLVSSVMALGWVGAVWLRVPHAPSMSFSYEASVAATFWLITLAGGVVFERLKRERSETNALRKRLAELALTDPLTALPNRRQFEELLHAELARIRRHGGECGVVMLDVDFFKTYNDHNGHVAGDEVLKQLAVLLRGQLRVGDLAARYGGEEFAILMPDTGRAEGLLVLERLRAVVEHHPFVGRAAQPGGQLTISGGIAVCPEHGCNYEELLRRADAALYAAKNAGRNRVHAAE